MIASRLVGRAVRGVQRERLVEQLAVEAHLNCSGSICRSSHSLARFLVAFSSRSNARDWVAVAGDEHVLGQVCELLLVVADQDRDRVCRRDPPRSWARPIRCTGPSSTRLTATSGRSAWIFASAAERLDGHQRHDPGGDLMAQLLGQVEDQQPLADPRVRNLERLGDALAGVAVRR